MKKIITLSLIIIAGVTACKKPEQALNTKNNKVHLNGENRDVASPTVSGGILTFTDDAHYNDWLEYLDESARRDSTSEDTTTTEEIFDGIESGLSFNSLRKKLRQDFNVLNATGWSSLDDVPVMHHIGDQSVLSTLNENGEVKIGNVIVAHPNADYELEIYDAAVLNTVRGFLTTAYADLNDIYLEPGITETNVKMYPLGKQKRFAGGTAWKTTGNGVQIEGKGYVDPCNNLKVTFKDYKVLEDNNFVLLYFSVNWGDGNTSTQTSTVMNLSHTYSTFGTYSVTITATAVSTSGVYFWSNTLTTSSDCNQASRNTGYVWLAVPDQTMAVRGYFSVTNETRKHRCYGSSESYHWKNGKWRAEKADALYVEACMEVLGGGCGAWFNKCGITSHARDQFVQDGFKVSGSFGWNVAYSNHALVHDAKWYTLHQTLSPCN